MKDDILALRIIKILPDDRWVSASSLAKAYADKFHSEITTAKAAAVLQYLFDNGLIQRKKKRRKWGQIAVYSLGEESDPEV